MKIITEYGIDGDKKLRYNLSEASGTNLSDMVGQRVQVKAYILFEDTDPSTGEPRKGLKILDDEGEYIGTRSQSFIAGFERFLECMEGDPVTEFEVAQGKSRAGRNYLTFKA